MKKIGFMIIAVIAFLSCNKQDVTPKQDMYVESSQAMQAVIPTEGPNLYPVSDEAGWVTTNPSGRVGLLNATLTIRRTTANSFLAQQYGVPIGTPLKMVDYPCLIANGIPGDTWDAEVQNPVTLSGSRDFTVNQDGSESIPVEIVTIANGGVYLDRKKDEFDYSPTDRRVGAVNGQNYSDKDFVWWGWGDTYFNSAAIPEGDGYYVIPVRLAYGAGNNPINPLFTLLPIHVVGNTATVDLTAIALNAAKAATNTKAVLQKGRVKGVTVSWSGDGYAYCIEKSTDGGNTWTMPVKWANIRSWFDAGASKSTLYRIITRAPGDIPDYFPTAADVFKVTNR